LSARAGGGAGGEAGSAGGEAGPAGGEAGSAGGEAGSAADRAGRDLELARIRSEYERRRVEVPDEEWCVRLFVRQLRERALLAELSRFSAPPLTGCRVLDVGCGGGQWLVDFETWGVPRENLAGIELDPEPAALARRRLAPMEPGNAAGQADIRVGNAGELPWPDGAFDIVLQATMLSSVLDDAVRRQIAREMARVLAPTGSIVSYDMRIPNPRNPHVRRITKRDLAELFEGFAIRARRVTLALPLSRRLVPLSWSAATALEAARVLDTHMLALLRRPQDGPR
jgi:SAM-dependent methyltransferase